MTKPKLDQYIVELMNQRMGFFIAPENKIFASQTQYQKLEIYDSSIFGRLLRLDAVFQTSEFDEYLYHEPLVHVPGVALAGPKTALVIGGGDGGCIEELLKYNTLKEVTMVELDSEVVDACKKYIPTICKNAFDDPRLNLRIEDGLKVIAEYQKNKQKFDQIILDLTDPFGPSMALYTKEFYSSINSILHADGAFSLHIEAPYTRPDLFSKIYFTLKAVFKQVNVMTNYVPLYGTLMGYAVASQSLNPNHIAANDIENRISSLGLHDLQFYNAASHTALLAQSNYLIKLLHKNVAQPVITLKNQVDVGEDYKHGLYITDTI